MQSIFMSAIGVEGEATAGEALKAAPPLSATVLEDGEAKNHMRPSERIRIDEPF